MARTATSNQPASTRDGHAYHVIGHGFRTKTVPGALIGLLVVVAGCGSTHGTSSPPRTTKSARPNSIYDDSDIAAPTPDMSSQPDQLGAGVVVNLYSTVR